MCVSSPLTWRDPPSSTLCSGSALKIWGLLWTRHKFDCGMRVFWFMCYWCVFCLCWGVICVFSGSCLSPHWYIEIRLFLILKWDCNEKLGKYCEKDNRLCKKYVYLIFFLFAYFPFFFCFCFLFITTFSLPFCHPPSYMNILMFFPFSHSWLIIWRMVVFYLF
jgi:hypothetical protein